MSNNECRLGAAREDKALTVFSMREHIAGGEPSLLSV